MTLAASHAELEHLLQRPPYDRIARLMKAASRHVTDMQMNSSLSCGAVATERLRSIGSARRGLARRGACRTERRARAQSIGAADSSVKVPWIILPGFIDLHDHLTWNIQPRWLTGRNLTIAKNGRIRGIGLLAEQSALPGNPDVFLRSGDVRGDQGACQWGDLGPRGLLSSDKSSANHPCVRDLPEIWIEGAGFSQSNRSPTGLAPGSLNLHAPNPLALAAERASVQDNLSQNGSKETAL